MNIRAILAGAFVFAAVLLIGVGLAFLAGCGGDDGARCERVAEDDGDAYLVCKTGHEVVYPIDDQGKPVERPDGKVDYQYPDEGS